MKKILAFLFIFTTILLSSCGDKTDTTKRVDNPDQALAAALNLETVKAGDLLNEVDETQEDYYKIIAAKDIKASLVVYESNLDAALENANGRTQSLSVSYLTFIEFSDIEKAGIISQLFNDNSKLKAALFSDSFELNKVNAWTKSFKEGVSDLQAAYTNGQRNNALSVIYLPIYVEHYQESKCLLEAYALVPVYYEITTVNEGVTSKALFNNYSKPALTFNSNNFLGKPQEETE